MFMASSNADQLHCRGNKHCVQVIPACCWDYVVELGLDLGTTEISTRVVYVCPFPFCCFSKPSLEVAELVTGFMALQIMKW